MPQKSKTNSQYVTKKEFKTSMGKIDERFEQVDKRFDKIEQNMATKDDISRLSKAIIKNSEGINSIKETMTTKDDIQRIITTMDNFTGRTIDHDRKAETNTHRIKEIEPKLEDHGKCITTLESTVSSKP